MHVEVDTIGAAIAEHRQRLGWTQRELGDQLGIGTSLIAKWEQGIRTPAHEWLVELDMVLGTTLANDRQPAPRRRGPRPAAGRNTSPRVADHAPAGRTTVSATTPVLVELTADGVRVLHGDRELQTVVLDLRSIQTAPANERARQISEMLLRSLDLPRPLADRVVRRLAELD